MDRQTVGIVIFDEVEVLDFCGPFEVFSVTRLEPAKRRETESPFDVRLVAEKSAPVRTTGGMTVTPMCTFADCPPLDLLLVPGGWGTRREMENPALIDWLRARGQAASILAAVCTGSLLLGRAGFLDERRATTHWQMLDRMRELFPACEVVPDKHFVRDGKLWTSAGISAGIDLALTLVAETQGEAVARATARHMEYPFPESDTRRIDF